MSPRTLGHDARAGGPDAHPCSRSLELPALASSLSQEGARAAFADFGVPRLLVPPAAVLLPIAELAVAVALLVPGSTVSGAAGACVLLIVFSAGVANSLAHGRRPACHCFGQFGSSQASWNTIARNAALAGAAAFVATAGMDRAESAVARYVQTGGARRPGCAPRARIRIAEALVAVARAARRTRSSATPPTHRRQRRHAACIGHRHPTSTSRLARRHPRARLSAVSPEWPTGDARVDRRRWQAGDLGLQRSACRPS